jgi:ribosomal protein S18 acetylase RimI-like enzyme
VIGDAFTIGPVASSADLDDVRALFQAYAASLPIDLGYQDFATELATLPGAYAPPAGALLLARDREARAIGCVALRALVDRPGPSWCVLRRAAPGSQGAKSELIGHKRAMSNAARRDAPPGSRSTKDQDGPLPPSVCEMKRLYVAPESRGLGLGRALLAAVLAEAERLGYRELRLDTLPTMTAAIAMYLQAGFVLVAPYYDTAPAGTLFLARRIDGRA